MSGKTGFMQHLSAASPQRLVEDSVGDIHDIRGLETSLAPNETCHASRAHEALSQTCQLAIFLIQHST